MSTTCIGPCLHSSPADRGDPGRRTRSRAKCSGWPITPGTPWPPARCRGRVRGIMLTFGLPLEYRAWGTGGQDACCGGLAISDVPQLRLGGARRLAGRGPGVYLSLNWTCPGRFCRISVTCLPAMGRPALWASRLLPVAAQGIQSGTGLAAPREDCRLLMPPGRTADAHRCCPG